MCRKLPRIFFTSLYSRFPPVRPFLTLIFAPTGFHNWGLATRWAQPLITSNYYLPSTTKDQSTIRKAALDGYDELNDLHVGRNKTVLAIHHIITNTVHVSNAALRTKH